MAAVSRSAHVRPALHLERRRSRRFCSQPRKNNSSGTAMKKKVKMYAAMARNGVGHVAWKRRKPRLSPSAMATGA